MLTDVYNFSPGPGALPRSVLEKVQSELLNWQRLGVSAMEVSHRSPIFMEKIVETSERRLRNLLSIPDNYRVLFLQGGAQLHFAGIPLNLAGQGQEVDYLCTGRWSDLAYQESLKYASISKRCNSKLNNYSLIPDARLWQLNDDAAYCYYCDNETVHGLEFADLPQTKAPLVADMSSNLLTKPINIEKFGLIVACAQKNFGPAGVTVIIVRDDLLERDAHPLTPLVMNYKQQAEHQSMINTPATFSWYVANEVFAWVQENGGVVEMDRLAQQRSSLLYDFIDQSNLYNCPVDVNSRSRINVVFDLLKPELLDEFLTQAEKNNLLFLKGHKARGGIRASMYNAMPIEGVVALINFMHDFQNKFS